MSDEKPASFSLIFSLFIHIASIKKTKIIQNNKNKISTTDKKKPPKYTYKNIQQKKKCTKNKTRIYFAGIEKIKIEK